MRYRALSADRDYTFGQGGQNFLVNSPATVSQAVLTRLLLLTGEWFLDTEEGTPYSTQILGAHTQGTYDTAIRERILDTEGVLGIINYSSNIQDRALTVEATIETVYGQTTLVASL